MSKVSAMQAMREARYAASRTARPAAPASSALPARTAAAARPAGEQRPEALTDVSGNSVVEAELPVTGAAPAVDDLAAVDVPGTAEALCGHRSMNNRTCRRPAGHPEKNHRYN